MTIDGNSVKLIGEDGVIEADTVLVNSDLKSQASAYMNGSSPVAYNPADLSAYTYVVFTDGDLEYPVWVAGVQVSDSNMNDVLGDGTVSYTPAGAEAATLVLNGAALHNVEMFNQNSAIIAHENLNVEVQGENTIDLTGNLISGAGIDLIDTSYQMEFDLALKGTGSLSISFTGERDSNSYGLYGNDVTIVGPTLKILLEEGGVDNTGIYAEGNVYIGDANVDITSGKVTHPMLTDNTALAVRAPFGKVSIDGVSVTLRGNDGVIEAKELELGATLEKTASEQIDGSSPVTFLEADLAKYRYLKLKPETIMYPVWVNSYQITSDNMNDVLGDGTVYYKPASGTDKAVLYLDNAVIENDPFFEENAAILAHEDLEVQVTGDCELKLHDGVTTVAGIMAFDKNTSTAYDVVLHSSGNLKITADDSGLFRYGILGSTVDLYTGNLEILLPDSEGKNVGIFAAKDVYFRNVGCLIDCGASSGDDSFAVETASGAIHAENGDVVLKSAQTAADVNNIIVTPAMGVIASKNRSGYPLITYMPAERPSYQYLHIGHYYAYPVWVQGVQVTSLNKDDVISSGGTVKYIPAEGSDPARLLLSGAEIKGGAVTGGIAGILSMEPLVINLDGENNIECNGATKDMNVWGVVMRDTSGSHPSLKLEGTGLLRVLLNDSSGKIRIGIQANYLDVEISRLIVTLASGGEKNLGITSRLNLEIRNTSLSIIANECENMSYGLLTEPNIAHFETGTTGIIKGVTGAISSHPIHLGAGVSAEGAASFDGTGHAPYDEAKHDSYKYISFTSENQPTRTVTVEKKWDDGDSLARPLEVKVQLYRDGAPEGAPVVLNDANGWKHEWKDLSGYSVWTVDEPTVPANYEKTVAHDQYHWTITNKQINDVPVPRVDVTVEKIWDDGNSASRPTEVLVQLYKDGVAVGSPVALSEINHWGYEWTSVYPRAVWTVDELNVPEGYEKTVTHNGHHWIITNKLKAMPPAQTVDVSVEKKWDDGNSAARPDKVTVQLYKDGTAYGAAVVLNKDNAWKHVWNGLEAGHDWSVDETDTPKGYTKHIKATENNWVITNKLKAEPGKPGKPGSPITGDAGVLLWIVSGALATAGAVWTKKRRG